MADCSTGLRMRAVALYCFVMTRLRMMAAMAKAAVIRKMSFLCLARTSIRSSRDISSSSGQAANVSRCWFASSCCFSVMSSLRL